MHFHCKNCADRFEGCHITCVVYKHDKEEDLKAKKQLKEMYPKLTRDTRLEKWGGRRINGYKRTRS